jgi:hypothetical protein
VFNGALIVQMKCVYLGTCLQRDLSIYMFVLSCVCVVGSYCITQTFVETCWVCTVTLIVPPRETTVRRSAAQTADGKNKSAGSRFSN